MDKLVVREEKIKKDTSCKFSYEWWRKTAGNIWGMAY